MSAREAHALAVADRLLSRRRRERNDRQGPLSRRGGDRASRCFAPPPPAAQIGAAISADANSSRSTAHSVSRYSDEPVLWHGPETCDPVIVYQPRTWLITLGLPADPATFAPARDPPQAELAWEDPA